MIRPASLLALLVLAACTGDDAPPDTPTDLDTGETTDVIDSDTGVEKKTTEKKTTEKKTEPCLDDAEDNDTAATAAELVPKTEYTVDDEDLDYFSIEVPAGQVLTVDVRFAHAEGDVQIALTAGKEVEEGTSASDDEQVVWTNAGKKQVDAVLEVTSDTKDACVVYTVETTLEDAPCTPIKDAKRVFLTEKEYDGDLKSPLSAKTGLEGADALCQLHADKAGLKGTWVAWLSDAKTDAIDRIDDVGPWYLPDQCTEMFSSKTGITFSGPKTPFNVDEHGKEIHPAVASFWSGTDRDGHSNGFHCTSWTSDSSIGLEGGRGSPHFDWDHADYWTDFVTAPCDHMHSLLCMEQ